MHITRNLESTRLEELRYALLMLKPCGCDVIARNASMFYEREREKLVTIVQSASNFNLF